MGNNHDQYFGKDKRKIIVLGLKDSGKSTLVDFIIKEKVNFNTAKTKNLSILDKKIGELNVTFFDLAGGQRQRIFWKQQYEGTQGCIFVIDAQTFQKQKTIIFQQLAKVMKNLGQQIPFAICLSKIDKTGSMMGTKVKNQIQKQFSQKKKFRIYQIDYVKNQGIKTMTSWLLGETKPI